MYTIILCYVLFLPSFLKRSLPITVTRHSHTTFGASYSISLVDTKSPPPTNFSNLPIVFTSSTAHQKLVVLVSYTGITKVETPSCPVPPNETIGTKKAGPQMLLDDQQWYIFMGMATLILVLAITVICLALKQSSYKPSGGFASHLPPAANPSTPAFTPQHSTPNPSQISATPGLLSQSSTGAFK